MEAFNSNCTKLDGDRQMVELLLSFIFGEQIQPVTHLTHLYQSLSNISLRNLWHGFLLKELSLRIHSNLLDA